MYQHGFLSLKCKAVVSITKTMAKTRQKPLVIRPYEFDGNKKILAAILLYADHVPFPCISIGTDAGAGSNDRGKEIVTLKK